MSVCALAYSLGANVIEKHFTFNKMLPGNDHYHSMDREDLKVLSRMRTFEHRKNTENLIVQTKPKVLFTLEDHCFCKKIDKRTTLDKSHMIAKHSVLEFLRRFTKIL